MFRFSANRQIARPADEIGATLIDFPNIPKWERGPIEVRQLSAGPLGVGTQIMARRVYGGRETTLEGVITEWDEGRSATMSLTGGPLAQSLVTYAVDPIGPNASVVTYTAEGTLVGALRILTPLMPTVGRAVARNNLRRLDELLADRSAGR
jgi:hypothetical protein